MKKVFSLLIIGLLFFNCKNNITEVNESTETATSEIVFEQLEPQDFADEIANAKDAQIVDVRTPVEFKSKSIANAVNIDFNSPNFDAEMNKLNKENPVFVYCLSGGRSKAAAEKMQKAGFKKIYELNGGMLKWNASGVTTETVNKPAETNANTEGISLEEYKKLISSNKKVLVDFNAVWCGPCRQMSPVLDKIQQEYKDKGFTLVKIDVDKNEAVSNMMKVDGIPYLVLYENGKKVWETVGYTEASEIKKHL